MLLSMKEIFCKLKVVTVLLLWWKLVWMICGGKFAVNIIQGMCFDIHMCIQCSSHKTPLTLPHAPPPPPTHTHTHPHTHAKEMLERRAHLYTYLLYWPQRVVSHLSTFSSFFCFCFFVCFCFWGFRLWWDFLPGN